MVTYVQFEALRAPMVLYAFITPAALIDVCDLSADQGHMALFVIG